MALPALIAGKKRKEAFAEARALLDSLGLAERVNHRPAQMSGGEKQRTAIARALINNPRIVFADEPTGSLDSRNRQEVQQIIADLCQRHRQTFLIVTHDPSLASIAHRVINMADGRIVSIIDNSSPQDSPEESEAIDPEALESALTEPALSKSISAKPASESANPTPQDNEEAPC